MSGLWNGKAVEKFEILDSKSTLKWCLQIEVRQPDLLLFTLGESFALATRSQIFCIWISAMVRALEFTEISWWNHWDFLEIAEKCSKLSSAGLVFCLGELVRIESLQWPSETIIVTIFCRNPDPKWSSWVLIWEAAPLDPATNFIVFVAAYSLDDLIWNVLTSEMLESVTINSAFHIKYPHCESRKFVYLSLVWSKILKLWKSVSNISICFCWGFLFFYRLAHIAQPANPWGLTLEVVLMLSKVPITKLALLGLKTQFRKEKTAMAGGDVEGRRIDFCSSICLDEKWTWLSRKFMAYYGEWLSK